MRARDGLLELQIAYAAAAAPWAQDPKAALSKIEKELRKQTEID